VVLNSDAPQFGGSEFPVEAHADTELVPYHGFEQSFTVSLPPLSMLVLVPEELPPPAAPDAPALSAANPEGKARKGKKAPKATKTPKAPKLTTASKPASVAAPSPAPAPAAKRARTPRKRSVPPAPPAHEQ
jgi:1,4-alpha-glucan branching enzyme